jgi:hypothetical protein
VLLIIYNPVIDKKSKINLIPILGFNDPDQLATEFIRDIQECSAGLVQYQIVERVEVDEIPRKVDGYQYKSSHYVHFYRTRTGFHQPDIADYGAIIIKFHLLERVASHEIDEVWMFGGPYFGFWESTMGGAGAFFTNSLPLQDTERCPRRFVIMGFNYERGVGEMLENISHRAESIMRRVYRSRKSDKNLFDRFLRYDKIAPQEANMGSVHFAPNSAHDYDWGNRTPVLSCGDDWYQYPHLPNPPNYRKVTAEDWGNGDIRAHHKWWLEHLPKVSGVTDGIANNWWIYIIDPNRVE